MRVRAEVRRAQRGAEHRLREGHGQALDRAAAQGGRPGIEPDGQAGTTEPVEGRTQRVGGREVRKAAQRRARDLGMSILLADSDEDPTTEMDLIRTLTKQVDGFLLCSPRGAGPARWPSASRRSGATRRFRCSR